jgi:PAS domain-containing protein
MLPLVFYLVVPTSYRGNVGGGLACGIVLLIGYLAPAPLSSTMPGMVLAMLILHCGMCIAIARNNRLQRQEWTAGQVAQAVQLELANSRDTLQRMFMAVPLPLLVTRYDGQILHLNRAAIDAYGAGHDVRLDNVEQTYVDLPVRDELFATLQRGGAVGQFRVSAAPRRRGHPPCNAVRPPDRDRRRTLLHDQRGRHYRTQAGRTASRTPRHDGRADRPCQPRAFHGRRDAGDRGIERPDATRGPADRSG